MRGDTMIDITFQYPPELMNLLIDTIPLLNRSKNDVLLFFRGAGVPNSLLNDIAQKIQLNSNSVNKYEIARIILIRLNEKGEPALRQRREILKRVTEFESFSTCWPNDQLKARGLVSEISKVVNIKDSFTRINLEREKERKIHQAEYKKRIDAEKQKREAIQNIHNELSSLFGEKDSWKRGKKLEPILNKLFNTFDILIKDAFTLKGKEGEGIVEQIDGVVEIDNHVYLVEMKWMKEPIGSGEISQHLLRVYNRGEVRGIFISASHYTKAAINNCIEALHHSVFVLCELREIVFALEREKDMKEFFREKVNAALLEKKPLTILY